MNICTIMAIEKLQIGADTMNFLLITYFRQHVTEYCAVIGTHFMVGVTNSSMAIPRARPFPSVQNEVWPHDTI